MFKGQRTIAAVLVGVLYFTGVKLGWWQLDPEVGSLITLLAIGFLRLGVANLKTKDQL